MGPGELVRLSDESGVERGQWRSTSPGVHNRRKRGCGENPVHRRARSLEPECCWQSEQLIQISGNEANQELARSIVPDGARTIT